MNRGFRRTVLLDLNMFLGCTAVAGGVALIVGWIKIPLTSLAGSPFTDFTVPAVLLTLIGGSAMLAAELVHLRKGIGLPVSAVVGGAIIVFEIVEWSVIGFAWLQAAYMAIVCGSRRRSCPRNPNADWNDPPTELSPVSAMVWAITSRSTRW
jgi:hypothetical protein